MARRKASKSPRRKTASSVNALNVAEGLVMWNVVSQNLFGIGGLDFFTAGSTGSDTFASGYQKGRSGGYDTNVITMREVFAMSQGTGKKSITDAIFENAKANAIPLVGMTIAVPIAFKFGKKLTSKPRAQANKLLKMSGLGVKV